MEKIIEDQNEDLATNGGLEEGRRGQRSGNAVASTRWKRGGNGDDFTPPEWDAALMNPLIPDH